jgi:hypothetical protein
VDPLYLVSKRFLHIFSQQFSALDMVSAAGYSIRETLLYDAVLLLGAYLTSMLMSLHELRMRPELENCLNRDEVY